MSRICAPGEVREIAALQKLIPVVRFILYNTILYLLNTRIISVKTHNTHNIYSKFHIKIVNLKNLNAVHSNTYYFINPNHYLLESNICTHALMLICVIRGIPD